VNLEFVGGTPPRLSGNCSEEESRGAGLININDISITVTPGLIGVRIKR
jgi:hypothetical protein